MDLTTSYLGMELKNPLVAGASPLTGEIESAKKLEEAGVSAIVARSLFQEQIEHQDELHDHYEQFGTESYAEAGTFLPSLPEFRRGPDDHLDYIKELKNAVSIPVIASLNGKTAGGWVEYATKLADTGIDALELNVYQVATDPSVNATQIEDEHIAIVRQVKQAVKVPVSVKLSPYFSALANFARRLEDEAGVDGLVLFNRFYQPDINLEELTISPELSLSVPHEMRLPLRWIAILDPIIKADLASTTGTYTALDVIKLLMAGANVTQVCATVLRNGENAAAQILSGMVEWMSDHEYKSVKELQGSMNQKHCPDSAAFERGQYMKTLLDYSEYI